jgi:hypothetical protein
MQVVRRAKLYIREIAFREHNTSEDVMKSNTKPKQAAMATTVLVGLLLVSTAQAATVSFAGTVRDVAVRAGGIVQVTFNETIDFGQPCTLLDRITSDGADLAASKALHAAALTALVTGRPIAAAVDGCAVISTDNTATGTAPKMKRFSNL